MEFQILKQKKHSLLAGYKNSYFSYFLMYNFYYLSWALFSVLISVYLLDRGYRASDVSLVVSGSFLASLLTQPLIGSLTDRYDAKKLNLALFGIAMIGAVLFLMADTLWMIAGSYALVMLILNGTNPVMEKVATASPYAYGRIRIWGTIGYALGSQLAGLIYDFVSPQAIFIAFLGTMALCVIGLAGTDSLAMEKKPEKEKNSLKSGNKKFFIYLGLAGVFFGITNVVNTYAPAMFQAKGLDMSVTSAILSAAVLCEAPIVLWSGKFMDRLETKTLMLIAFGLVLVQLGVYALDLKVGAMVAITLMAKHPAGMLFIMINLKAVASLVDANRQISALALVQTVKSLFSIGFQNVAGNLLNVVPFAQVYLICGCVLGVALLVLLGVKLPSTSQKLFQK
ncbi:MFS transporter [Dubosiella muris]|uniref:MFS transporter n=4 Tax=Dubosiella TaxID=1937008 RepID=UPI00240FE75A|nr:MFS transporter [Dubosiella muris]